MGRGRVMLELSAERRIEAETAWQGPDLVVRLWGGAAHVGAVALGEPRPEGLPGRSRASASVLTACGHRDEAVALPVARELAAALGVRVVVVAGLHWDDLDADGLAAVGASIGPLVAALREVAAPG